MNLLQEARKKLTEDKFFVSVAPLTNPAEELCLFLRLAVCLKPLSIYRFYTCIMYTKLLMNRISLAFNKSVKTLLRIMHLNRCTQLF